MISLLLPLLLSAQLSGDQTPGERLLTYAQQLEGVAYDFGGRMRDDEGIDCQGIIFYGAERLTRCDWRSWSVLPTRTVAKRELGQPAMKAPMRAGALDLSKLKPGDVLYLLGPQENPKEPALFKVRSDDGPVPMWVWHMGLYAGDGKVLHADPFTKGKVHTEPLAHLMHAGGFEALFATRLHSRPKPQRCRRGTRMTLPLSPLPQP